MPKAVSDSLRQSTWRLDSVGPGTFKQRMDQEHKDIVMMQLQMMSNVPRPAGPLVHPSLGDEYSTWLMSAKTVVGSRSIFVWNGWTPQIETCTFTNRNIVEQKGVMHDEKPGWADRGCYTEAGTGLVSAMRTEQGGKPAEPSRGQQSRLGNAVLRTHMHERCSLGG